jgi:hypothetical protein
MPVNTLYASHHPACRRYQDWSGKTGRLRPTPATMAGVKNRLWNFIGLFPEVANRYH